MTKRTTLKFTHWTEFSTKHIQEKNQVGINTSLGVIQLYKTLQTRQFQIKKCTSCQERKVANEQIHRISQF